VTGIVLSSFLSAARPVRAAPLALAILASGSPVSAQDPVYPAAQCAAFWYGYADYADLSPYLDASPTDLEAAEAFREVALRLAGDASEVEQFISEQRPQMVRLMESYIFDGDVQSRDIFERLTATCEDFAADHPETRNLK